MTLNRCTGYRLGLNVVNFCDLHHQGLILVSIPEQRRLHVIAHVDHYCWLFTRGLSRTYLVFLLEKPLRRTPCDPRFLEHLVLMRRRECWRERMIYSLVGIFGHKGRVKMESVVTLSSWIQPKVCVFTVVLYCWSNSDSASVLLYFT